MCRIDQQPVVLRSRRQALQAAPEKDAAAVRAVGGRQSTSMSTVGTGISGVCRIDQQPVVLRSRRQARQAAPEKDAAAVRAVGGRQSTSMSTLGTGMSAACHLNQQPHVVLRSRRQALVVSGLAAERRRRCPRNRRSSVDIHVDMYCCMVEARPVWGRTSPKKDATFIAVVLRHRHEYYGPFRHRHEYYGLLQATA